MRQLNSRILISSLLFEAFQLSILGVNFHLEAHQVGRSFVKVKPRVLRMYPFIVPPTVTENCHN